MTAITTVAELEALPVGTPLTDCDGDIWRKLPNDNWSMLPGRSFGAQPEYLLETYGPLSRTDAAAEPLNMTRCASDGCMDAHALPAGAFYLCPQHRGHITLGRD